MWFYDRLGDRNYIALLHNFCIKILNFFQMIAYRGQPGIFCFWVYLRKQRRRPLSYYAPLPGKVDLFGLRKNAVLLKKSLSLFSTNVACSHFNCGYFCRSNNKAFNLAWRCNQILRLSRSEIKGQSLTKRMYTKVLRTEPFFWCQDYS